MLDNLSLSAVAEDTPGDGEGEVVWTYAVPNSEIDFLAAGETVEATFTVEVDDLNSVDMEVATVGGITETATTVNFGQVFDTAPVVFVLLGEEDTGPAILRIDNVTTTGFDLAQLEADVTPSTTTAATVTYFAIEKGVHTIGGVTFEVGTHTTTTQQHGAGAFTPGAEGYDAIALTGTFTNAPTVVAAVQTSNNPVTTLATAIRSDSVTTSGFDLALERAEDNIGTLNNAETIGWIAVEEGPGSFTLADGTVIDFDAVTTADDISGWGEEGVGWREGIVDSDIQ